LLQGHGFRVGIGVQDLENLTGNCKHRFPERDFGARGQGHPIRSDGIAIRIRRVQRIHTRNEERPPIEEQVGMDLGNAVRLNLPGARGPDGEGLHRFVGGQANVHLVRVSHANLDLQVRRLLGHGVGVPACRAA
jgi:hypothetical protein